GDTHRVVKFFSSLSKAKSELDYLCFQGVSFNGEEQMMAAVAYIRKNQHLKILHAEVFRWSERAIKNFARVLADHAGLATFLSGIIELESAGKIFFDSILQSKNIKNVYPFPGANISTGCELCLVQSLPSTVKSDGYELCLIA
ncbi:MAG: hypothetical protein ACHQVK_04130, partial [Candidatus Paceibacterales bacterium]